ncbi:MAG: VWA domain-containing protein [Planctomycetes bacterium]|nr:VWA domain-containing protein [Planctomycetota bacterium]
MSGFGAQALAWLGVEGEVPPGATTHFEWGHRLEGDSGLLVVLLGVAVVALTVWLYRREGSASAWRKGFLATLRLLAFAGLLLVFLEPQLAVDLERRVPGKTIVLWDTSLSLSLTDSYAGLPLRDELAKAAGLANPEHVGAETRAALAWRIVRRAELLPELAAQNELVLYAFAQRPDKLPGVTQLQESPPEALPAVLEPAGASTDLVGALRKALEEVGAARVAAVVAITDGRLNKGEAKDGLREVLQARNAPFYAIGIGDPTMPRNLEVAKLACEEQVVLNDPMVIEGEVRGQGYAGEAIEVELTRKPEGGTVEVLETQTVTLGADGSTQRLSFRHTPTEVGTFVFQLRIPPRDEELVSRDNARTQTVKVSDEGLKVLLIAGSPGFEYHFLRTRLIREKTAIVSCWLQSADPRFPQDGNEQLTEFPGSFEQLEGFDAVILIDPNPEGFDARAVQALKTFVADHKGGLMLVPGPKYSAELWRLGEMQPLRDLLPVIGQADPGPLPATESFPLKATADGWDHPASRLDPNPERCRQIWEQLPGFFYSYPLERAKSGATVLVRHQDPGGSDAQGGRPVLVAHFFDGGPVLYLGAGETWRWRSVARKVYDRFWVGVLRFLIQGRLGGGRKRLELLLDREEYDLGDPVLVRARVFDRGFQPLAQAEVEVEAEVDGERRTLTLKSVGGPQPGWYETSFLPQAQGEVVFSGRAPDADPGDAEERVAVMVRFPDREFSDPRLDRELLVEVSTASGGAYVEPTEVDALAARIPSVEETVVVAGAPIALWDRGITIWVLVLLLGIEWAVRKRSRMI